MARPLPSPTLRKKRILRDGCLLLLTLALLLAALGFPCLTRGQALSALQKANFFDGGCVVTWSLPPDEPDTACAVLQMGDWYALGQVRRAWPFWEPVRFDAVRLEAPLPVVLLPEDPAPCSFLCVLSGVPEMVWMELDYLTLSSEAGQTRMQLNTLRQERVENCFLFSCDGSAWVPTDDPFQSIRLRGYNAAGDLIYESPEPEGWADYGLDLPE